jgi:hypothetical protein
MLIYRIDEPRFGAMRAREWRLRALHALSQVLIVLGFAATGVAVLDKSNNSLGEKVFTAVWNGVNLVTTLGDFSEFGEGQKEFMLMAMFATMLVGAFAVTKLSGVLSGDEVMIHRENRIMQHKLEHPAKRGRQRRRFMEP